MKVPLVVLSLIAIPLVALFYLRDPATGYGLPPCSFKILTGYHCPGCGGTRSVHALLHGRIADAFSFNPLFICTLALVPVAAARSWLRRRHGRKGGRLSTRQGIALALTIVTAVLGFGIVRNLPWYPWLKPPALDPPAATHQTK